MAEFCREMGLDDMASEFEESENKKIPTIWDGWDVHGNSALHIACRKNCLDVVDDMLAAGADPNTPNRINGRTPIFSVIFSHNPSEQMAGRLIAGGARLDARISNGITPLHSAASLATNDEYTLLHILLSNGADAMATTIDQRWTPMHFIFLNKPLVAEHMVKAVQDLIGHGAQTEVRDKNGKSPLDLLCLHCPLELIQAAVPMLLSTGAKVTYRSFSGVLGGVAKEEGFRYLLEQLDGKEREKTEEEEMERESPVRGASNLL